MGTIAIKICKLLGFSIFYFLIHLGIVSKTGEESEALKRVFISSIIFNNAGNMPITLMISVAQDIYPFNQDPEAAGTQYLECVVT